MRNGEGMEEVKGKRSSRWTSLEVTLIVFCALGTVVCAGLIAVAWLAIDDNSQLSAKDETNEISGKMKIVGGASYSPLLHDPTSTEFKILAFDVEHRINKVYSESSMKDDYAGCHVVAFEQGSVWVLLGLKFTLATSEGLVGTAQGTLLAAISPSTPVSNVGFLPPFEVDIASVQVYGDKPSTPTSKPTPAPNNTSTPIFKPTPAPNNTSTPTFKPTPAPNNTSTSTFKPTPAPNNTSTPTFKPTPAPNNTSAPTFKPTPGPNNTSAPTFKPTPAPNKTSTPTFIPTPAPNNTSTPTFKPTPAPNKTSAPTSKPTPAPNNTSTPTFIPTPAPNNTSTPTFKPTPAPNNTSVPTFKPTPAPNKTGTPTFKPTPAPNKTSAPTSKPTPAPNNTSTPTFIPTPAPNNTSTPTFKPTPAPNNTSVPTFKPTPAPNKTGTPTFKPTPASNNTSAPTFKPTPAPNNTSAPTCKTTPAPNKTSTPTFKPTPASNNASTATLKSTLVPVTSKESCGSVELWEPNTTFSSPNYPNNYSVNTLCFWFLRAQEGDNVQLHFQDFDMETDNDMVMVYDGNSTSAMLIGMFSGSGPGRDLFSTGSVMTVRFRSDFVTNCKGFLANFTTGFRLGMPPLCGSDEFQCDNYQCVPSSAVCDGRPDCTDTSDEKHCARLVNGTVVASGVVQLFVHGRWRGLCANDSWEELARNTCLSTGYPGLNGSALVAAAGYGPYVSLFINSSSVGAVISESCDAGRVLYVNCIPKACGRRRRRLVPESRVVQGSDAAPGAWPWMVDLRSKGQHLCGASLLSRDWLLTAAHCVRGHEAVDLTAAFGLRSQLNFSSSAVEQRLVAQVHGHRDYNHYSKDNDIALLRLASPVNYTDEIQPVCLPEGREQFFPGTLCYVAGWGLINNAGELADVLQEAGVPLVSHTKCQDDWRNRFDISDNMVCAGFAEGGSDTCGGDSGGPLMCEEQGHWHLVGISSFGDYQCGLPNRPGVYTDVLRYQHWISGIVEGAQGSSGGSWE
ncbi:uncharacterized protein LOC144719686 isoform X2 [Lampetra planeri]